MRQTYCDANAGYAVVEQRQARAPPKAQAKESEERVVRQGIIKKCSLTGPALFSPGIK